MFTAISNIFAPQPRTAEQTDTRQALQRHDPDYHQKNKKKNRDSEDGQDDFNNAVVSVEALRLFLQKFLKTAEDRRKQSQDFNGIDRRKKAETEQKDTFTSTQQQMPLMDDSRQKSAQAARAAYAYQSMQRPKPEEKVLLETTDQGTGPEFDLSAEDVRAVYTLLDNLKILSERNIEYLQIETAETFILSLTNAVEKALKT